MYQKRTKKRVAFVIAVVIILTLIVPIIKSYYTEKTYVATFKGMYMRNAASFWDKSLVYAETDEGEQLTFSVEYLIRHGDGINLGSGYNCVWFDHKYEFTVIGWRIEEKGIYENIVRVKER